METFSYLDLVVHPLFVDIRLKNLTQVKALNEDGLSITFCDDFMAIDEPCKNFLDHEASMSQLLLKLILIHFFAVFATLLN